MLEENRAAIAFLLYSYSSPGSNTSPAARLQSMSFATVFPDTTILIQYQSFDRIDWESVLGIEKVKILLTSSVMQEMEDIKNQSISPGLARRAGQALQSIQTLLEHPTRTPSVRVVLINDPEIDFQAEDLDPSSVTDVLVASIISYQREYSLEYLILLSEDERTRNKARAAGIEIGSLPQRFLYTARKQTPDPKKRTIEIAPAKQKPAGSESSVPVRSEKLLELPPLFPSLQESDRSEPATPDSPRHKVLTNGSTRTPEEDSRDKKSDSQNPGIKREKTTPFVEFKQDPTPLDPGYFEIFYSPGSSGEGAPQMPVPSVSPSKPHVPRKEFPVEPPFSNGSRLTEEDDAFIPEEAATTDKSGQTELRLAFGEHEDRTSIIIHHPVYPSIDDVVSKMAQIRKAYPKLNAPVGEHGGDGIEARLANTLTVTNNDILVQRRSKRIDRYNGTLDAYYANCEKYLGDIAEFENLRRRTAQLNLALVNELDDSLKSLYIVVHFPGHLRVHSEENLPERPLTPSPPEKPNFSALFDTIRLPDVVVPGELANGDAYRTRSGNIAPIEVRWNKGWDVIYSVREIEKRTRLAFNPVYITFNSFDRATSFRIQYRATVASASYEELGELEVVVRREL